jgi:hypothetical protein
MAPFVLPSLRLPSTPLLAAHSFTGDAWQAHSANSKMKIAVQ